MSVITNTRQSVTYRVEHLFSYGWDDAGWERNGLPWLFDSHADAWAEIDDLCSITTFDEPYAESDFRVVVVTDGN
jgi:hypothetical protein